MKGIQSKLLKARSYRAGVRYGPCQPAKRTPRTVVRANTGCTPEQSSRAGKERVVRSPKAKHTSITCSARCLGGIVVRRVLRYSWASRCARSARWRPSARSPAEAYFVCAMRNNQDRVTYKADMGIDCLDTSVRVLHQQLGCDQLFDGENDTVLATHANARSVQRK